MFKDAHKTCTEMKQTIEQAAEAEFTKAYTNYKVRRMGFSVGAKSEAAREYHTQGMYSEEEVSDIAIKFFYHWYNSPGNNTQAGFYEWFENYKKKRDATT